MRGGGVVSRPTFPILVPYERRDLYKSLGLPKSVPWSLMEPHEEQAQNNHQQSLKRLAERGGLCALEMAAVISGKSWREAESMSVEAAATVILEALATPTTEEK